MYEQDPRPVEPDTDDNIERRKTAVELIGFIGISAILAATAVEASDFGIAYSVYPGVLAITSTAIASKKWKDLISPARQD